eukprot:GHVT01021347.1.p1 GENE.GHVT01021347.1~~GHVT01021347.1.p1  ORF type:complete len:115 (+),score=8.17 GHVT01021347.1:247-591(+)
MPPSKFAPCRLGCAPEIRPSGPRTDPKWKTAERVDKPHINNKSPPTPICQYACITIVFDSTNNEPVSSEFVGAQISCSARKFLAFSLRYRVLFFHLKPRGDWTACLLAHRHGHL